MSIKKFTLIFFLLVAGSSLFFFYSKKEEKKPSFFPVTEQKPFVVIIPSYNNAKYVEKNLRSVLSQDYSNYRVIYIDDASSDATLLKANRVLEELDAKRGTTLIHNSTNQGALANIYNAAHSCKDEEIIIIVDGDDALAHEHVLSYLNKVYANPNVWITYGNYLDYPSYTQNPKIAKKIPAHVLKKNKLRGSPWVTTHLRTFYAALFKKIQLEDFFYRGRFYSMGADVAMMLPMIEMAKEHSHFIDECLYLYNRENPINDHKINFAFQNQCKEHICARKSYAPLPQLSFEAKPLQTTDFFIFSQDRPLQLYALLESAQEYLQGLSSISVVYQASSTEFEKGYADLKSLFPQITFQSTQSLSLKELFEKSPSSYVLLAEDSSLFKDFIELSQVITILENTQIEALYFGYHPRLNYSSALKRYQSLPSYSPLPAFQENAIPCVWEPSSNQDDWAKPHPLQCVLYRKSALKNFLPKEFSSIENLIENWKPPTLGLFFDQSKSLQLKLTHTPSELLEKFNEGLKIDFRSLFQLSHCSQEVETELPFIERSSE